VNLCEKSIALFESILRTDPEPTVRITAIQNLVILCCDHSYNPESLVKAATTDPDPRVRSAAIKAITSLYISSTSMSEKPLAQPTVQMTFNAPVYGAAGNIEGNQVINVTDQNFDALLTDYQQFFNDLQQKYPTQPPEAALQPLIDAEFQEIQKTQPQRWQNFLNLKRLWNGGKKATFKMGEHFTEENLWGKMAIAFLEGITDNPE
jgi:HEAT repeats